LKEEQKMKFDFNMEWEDLPEEFRKQKIDEVIEVEWGRGDFDGPETPSPDDYEYSRPELAQVQEDEEIRTKAENWISAHFPIYF